MKQKGNRYCEFCLKYHEGNCLKLDKHNLEQLTNCRLKRNKYGYIEEDDLRD